MCNRLLHNLICFHVYNIRQEFARNAQKNCDAVLPIVSRGDGKGSNVGQKKSTEMYIGLPNKLPQALPLNTREEQDEDFGGGGSIQSFAIANLLRVPRISVPIVSRGEVVTWSGNRTAVQRVS